MTLDTPEAARTAAPPGAPPPTFANVNELLAFVRENAGVFGGVVALTAIVVVAVVAVVVGQWLNPVSLLSVAATLVGLLILAIALINLAHLLIDPASTRQVQRNSILRLAGLVCLLVIGVLVWNLTNSLSGLLSIRDIRVAYAAITAQRHRDAVSLAEYATKHCAIKREEDIETLRNEFSPTFVRDVVRGAPHSLDRATLSAMTQCESIMLDRPFDIGGPYRHDVVLAASTVHLTQDAVLRIGGRTLYIIANRLIAEKGARIEAFPPQQSSKLERAQDAGHVRIVLFETPVAADKPLVISLRGEDGRDGEQGSNASPRKVAWRPPSRQYEQRLVPLLQSAPVGRDDVPECSEAENRRRWSMIDWAALGPVYKGPISDNVANIRRLLACAEKDPPKGGGTTDPGQQSAKSEGTDPGRRSAKSGADRSAKAIQQDFAEIDELLGKKGNVLMCLRSVDAGHPGANGHPMAINGGNGRDGGRGGSVIAIYPEANGERPSWLQIETNGGQGGWAGLPGRPQEDGDGEVAVDTPMHLASCGPALAGPPGEDGASGMPGHRGRNGSEGQASFVRLPDLR